VSALRLTRRGPAGVSEWQKPDMAEPIEEDEPSAVDGVFAWKCENCDGWSPGADSPFAVLVDVPARSEITLESGYTKRLRARRVMVVCARCRDLMGGLSPQAAS
jgi:hypothetical protein